MSVITNKKFKKQNKSVLLFSGGMDSLMYAYLIKPDRLLYISSNSNYDKRELERLKTLTKMEPLNHSELIIDSTTFNLSKHERDDFIVPNRNLYFIALASLYGEKIYLASVEGDRSLDKDSIFFEQMSQLLSHTWKEQHWTEERKIEVESPYKNMTKTELVKLYLEKGGSKELLLTSWSCYKNEIKPCGVCKPCFRKWVALMNNNIDTNNYFMHHPSTSPWIKDIMASLQKNEYRGREDRETLSALNENNWR